MNFEQAVINCYNDKDFIKEYNRLTNSELKVKQSPINNVIDYETNKKQEEIKNFINFVEIFVWSPLVKRVCN